MRRFYRSSFVPAIGFSGPKQDETVLQTVVRLHFQASAPAPAKYACIAQFFGERRICAA